MDSMWAPNHHALNLISTIYQTNTASFAFSHLQHCKYHWFTLNLIIFLHYDYYMYIDKLSDEMDMQSTDNCNLKTYWWMLIEMASCDVSAATLENLGQGLFGIQLEVRELNSPQPIHPKIVFSQCLNWVFHLWCLLQLCI